MTSGKILLVEDEDSLALGLIDVLRVKGYEVERAALGQEALSLTEATNYDLVLLDVELPDISGFEILKSLRARGDDCRVLMLTARSSELDKVLGFELGVDDYVAKPFSLSELLGRIQALLRRSVSFEASKSTAEATSDLLQLGDTTIDFKGFQARKGDQDLRLPAKAFSVLSTLLEKEGEVVSRDQLIDCVWGEDEFVAPRTLNNLIVKIRQAIEERPEEPQFLVTVHGLGYRFVTKR